jgi:hypothetical protein
MRKRLCSWLRIGMLRAAAASSTQLWGTSSHARKVHGSATCLKVAFPRHGRPDDLQHVFGDAVQLASGEKCVDSLTGMPTTVPAASTLSDVVAGFPCQYVSALNNKRGGSATVIEDSSMRTGSVYNAIVKYDSSAQDDQDQDRGSFLEGVIADNVIGLAFRSSVV